MPKIKRLLISQVGNGFIVSPCDPADDITVLSADRIAGSIDGNSYVHTPEGCLLDQVKKFFSEKPPETLDTDLQP